MKRIHLVIIILTLLSSVFSSCNKEESEFEQEYNQIKDEKTGEELFNALLDLDQRYPDKLVLKVNIGEILITTGNLEKAELYLKRGETIVNTSNDKSLHTQLFTYLAELSYKRSEFEKGIEYADKALMLNPDETVKVIFIKGKCQIGLAKLEEAFENLQKGWNELRDDMSREDMKAYMTLLAEKNKLQDILEVLKAYQLKFGYEFGAGLQESTIYENLGMIDESIIEAAKELEYQRYYGIILSNEEIEKLQLLEEKLNDKSWNPEEKGKEIIQGLIFYVQGNWEKAEELFSEIELKQEVPFFNYLLFSSKMEKGGVPLDELEEFVKIEPYFKDLPGYYYHLWRGMKNGSENYNLNIVRNILEKCIILSPGTEYAKETRGELGDLLGLTRVEGEKILLGLELDAIYYRLLNGANPIILEPVMELLSVPDNIYGITAVLMLKNALSVPVVRLYLLDKKENSTGRLKERLVSIVGK